jgi:hypothetical protein
MKFTLLATTLATAMVATALPSFAQTPPPAMLSVVRYEVKRDRIPEFEEVEKQIAGSYKKAATPGQFRNIYRDAIGNTAEYWVITPMSKFADRDGENPYDKMATEQERAARGARLAQYIETVRTSIDRTISDLSFTSQGTSYPPAWVRYIRVRVRPGTTEQVIANVKTDVLPGLKKMNGITLRARQTLFGGNVNEFTIAAGFEKWADLDDTAALPKAMGEATFRKFEEKMQAIETNVEEYILRYQPDLSYYPNATATTSRR